MNDQIQTIQALEVDADVAGHGSELVEVVEQSLVRRGAHGLRRAWQRGMATAEYAVGILAAVALALVLLRIFTNNDFFATLLKFVVGLIGRVSGMLP